MSLKAILFDFNGVIINDESIHQELIDEILLKENLRPSTAEEYKTYCLGKSDRAALQDILTHRGRVITEDYLNKLITNKSQTYRDKLTQLETLPIYNGVKEFLPQVEEKGITMGIVTGALRNEVLWIIEKAGIKHYFDLIISSDDIKTSKPQPEGYLLAVERLSQPPLNKEIEAKDCLIIEDTFAGIEAAKAAKIQVVGVANTYPCHMLQRQANWTVDYLTELELDRIDQLLQ